MARQQETWRIYAGRDWGGDHYHFGDHARHWWRQLNGAGSSTSSATDSIDDSDRALLDVKVQRDQLVSHRRRMDSQVTKDDEAARSMVKESKKQQAMLALRKKKQHEQLAVDVQTHLNRLEELIASIEFSRLQKEAVEALAEGVKMLKRVQKETGGVDYVNRLMDERDEALLEKREISDALASVGVAADDADAMAEYDRLVEAHAAAQLVASTDAPEQPVADVPAAGDASGYSQPAAPAAALPGAVATPKVETQRLAEASAA
jgi:charged multivesicular body protein 6